MDRLFLVITDSFLWRWKSMWLASVVRMSRGCCALLGRCDEAAGSITTKEFAYDIANGTFSLAATDRFAVAIVSMISTMRRCVFSMYRSRGDWSSLCIYTGRSRAN